MLGVSKMRFPVMKRSLQPSIHRLAPGNGGEAEPAGRCVDIIVDGDDRPAVESKGGLCHAKARGRQRSSKDDAFPIRCHCDVCRVNRAVRCENLQRYPTMHHKRC